MLQFDNKSREFNEYIYKLAKPLFTNRLSLKNALNFEQKLHNNKINQQQRNEAASILWEMTNAVREELYNNKKSTFFMNTVQQLANEEKPPELHDTTLTKFNALLDSVSVENQEFYQPFNEYLQKLNEEERVNDFIQKAKYLKAYEVHLERSDAYFDTHDYKDLDFDLTEKDAQQIKNSQGKGAA